MRFYIALPVNLLRSRCHTCYVVARSIFGVCILKYRRKEVGRDAGSLSATSSFIALERLSSPSAETFGTAKVLEAKWASLDSSLLEVEQLEMVPGGGNGGGVSCSFIPRKHLYVEPIETPTTDEPTLIVR